MKVVAFSILLSRKTYRHTHIYIKGKDGPFTRSTRQIKAKEHQSQKNITKVMEEHKTTNTLINKKTVDKKGAVYHKSARNEDALAKVLYLGTLAQSKSHKSC
jgi:hypothetical protein